MEPSPTHDPMCAEKCTRASERKQAARSVLSFELFPCCNARDGRSTCCNLAHRRDDWPQVRLLSALLQFSSFSIVPEAM